ncbi:MAG: bacteriohemerythrin [Mariprofundus sp.]|nr:bacteriohemerythrin [Mariprofundus sp.]
MITTTEIFPWNTNFETGIIAIDDQHQQLVSLVNKLANHVAYDSDQLTLNEVFTELTDYTIYHFNTEEAIWAKYMDPAVLAAHQHTHQTFIDEVSKAIQTQNQSPSEDILEQTLTFLTHWLAVHILDDDKRLAKITLAMQQGMSLQDAKICANAEMNGAAGALIDSVLSMYDSLSSRTLALMREIARRQRTEQKLLLSKSAIDSTLEAIFITDPEWCIIDANPSFCTNTGRQYEELIGKDIREIKASLFKQDATLHIWKEVATHDHWRGEITGTDSEGTPESVWLTLSAVKNSDGQISNYAGVLSSISHLIEQQKSLELAVNHDTLTGLANRRLLKDRLKKAIQFNARNKQILAICFLDLDGFKAVNDTLGHAAGDVLLCSISSRLQNLIRKADTIARVGGDEFVMLFGELNSQDEIHPLLQKVLANVAQPLLIDGTEISVSASIGVSIYTHDDSLPEELLKRADSAMYIAKNNGKSRYHLYTEK